MFNKLYEIRCPRKVVDKKTGKLIPCNKLCVKVYPGSSGQVQCRSCKLKFDFYVDSQAKSLLSVRAQPVINNKDKE